jgi:hypothetical protein
MTEPLFFMQDNRQMVGDCIMWWGEGGNGYVTDIGRAKRFTLKEAVSQNRDRHTDIPWPLDLVTSRSIHTVDMQQFRQSNAFTRDQLSAAPDDQLFLLQEKNTYNGNDFLFRATVPRVHLTPNIDQASRFTKWQAIGTVAGTQNFNIWPASQMEAKQRSVAHLCDFEDIQLADELKKHGIELHQPEPVKKERISHRCCGCGRIMSSGQMWAGSCGHCGVDSRP